MEPMFYVKYLGWFMVMVFNAIIKNISVISWGVSFNGRRKPEYPVKSTDLQQVADKLYHIRL